MKLPSLVIPNKYFVTSYEVAELLNLQTIRETARTYR